MIRLFVCVVLTIVLMPQQTDAEERDGMINSSQSDPGGERNPKDLPIVAYADRLSVQPGETIQFMVSSKHGRYLAEILRLFHSDPNPSGPGIK